MRRSSWSEPLRWATAAAYQHIARERPLPLALHPRPSVTADMVQTALRSAGIEYLIVLSSPSIAGLRAGIMAGLGIGAFGRNFMPEGLQVADEAAGLPELPRLEFGLERREGALSRAVEALARLIEDRGLYLSGDDLDL